VYHEKRHGESVTASNLWFFAATAHAEPFPGKCRYGPHFFIDRPSVGSVVSLPSDQKTGAQDARRLIHPDQEMILKK
jgi:hypothetical protein